MRVLLTLFSILFLAITLVFIAKFPPSGPPVAHGDDRPMIQGDLVAFNQAGEQVRLSELHGKVWVATGFFAVCPLCARSNSTDLKNLSRKFADHPDFQLVCISIDPEQDDIQKLRSYAQAMGADVDQWWFLTGSREKIHRYLERDLKFPPVVERTDPGEISSLGRYRHDLGIIVVDRHMRIAGKRNLSWAADQNPGLHQLWEQHLHGVIQNELSKPRPNP